MKNQLEILPVRWIDKVVEILLVEMPNPLAEEEVNVEVVKIDESATPSASDAWKH